MSILNKSIIGFMQVFTCLSTKQNKFDVIWSCKTQYMKLSWHISMLTTYTFMLLECTVCRVLQRNDCETAPVSRQRTSVIVELVV